MNPVNVGDVLAVRTGGFGGWAIRVGAMLRGLPHGTNHIVIAHHEDPAGVWWGIEGRPGGVGWVDMGAYLASPATVTNADQPRTDAQRQAVASAAEAMLHTPYDWDAIVCDAGYDLRLPNLFAENWKGKGSPGHLVCSSLAAWVHDHVGLPRPHGEARLIQPAHWAGWDAAKGWLS